MNILFFILLSISFIALIVGLIKPSIVRIRSRKVVALVFVGIMFVLFIALASTIVSEPTQSVATQPVQEISPIFDVPPLLGKNVDQLKVVLGTPADDSEPTQQQIQLGTDTWDKSWHKAGYVLLATYDVKSRDVIDLFIGTDSDKANVEFQNTDNILRVGNLSATDNNYSVEFVKAKNASGYTGAIIKQK